MKGENKFDFIIFSFSSDWQTCTRKPHYAAIQKYGRLFFIEAQKKIKRRIIFKENIYHINISYLDKLFPQRLEKALEKYLFNKPVIIFAGVWWYDFINIFQNAIKIFEVNDYYSLFPNISKKERNNFFKGEDIFSKKCNLIITASEKLKKHYLKINPHTYWLPNTAIIQDLNKHEIPEGKQKAPARIASPGHHRLCRRHAGGQSDAGGEGRRVGFVGNINNWLDIELIEKIIKNNPDKSFIFIGKVNEQNPIFLENWRKLFNYKNFNYLGWKKAEDLWQYICSFDLAWIPYRKTEFLSYVHPNKIYQYLACGKPVIATEFMQETTYFEDLVEFGDLNLLIQKEKYNGSEIKRINFAKMHSPEKRAEALTKLLE